MSTHSFPSKNKLKSRKAIQRLFSDGKFINRFPLSVVYLLDYSQGESRFKVGFSVSKRLIRSAVKRNRIKRQMREVFRTQKNFLSNIPENQILTMMFLYKENSECHYATLRHQMSELLKDLNRATLRSNRKIQ